MARFYPLLIQSHVALSVPNMSPILLSISLGRYNQVYIKPFYKDIYFNSPICGIFSLNIPRLPVPFLYIFHPPPSAWLCLLYSY